MKEISPRPRPTGKQCTEAAERALQDSLALQRVAVDSPMAAAKLNARLADNFMLYAQGDLQDQRDAVADSLLAVEVFLSNLGISKLALQPILRPVEALVERENNTTDPMFAERKRGGKPKRTLDKLNRIGILASLADAWLSAHSKERRDQDALLREAARAFKGQWFNGLTKAQLKTARDYVSQSALEDIDHPSVLQARLTKAQIEQAAEQYGAKNAIHVIVAFLNASPRSFAFGNTKILETPTVCPNDDG